jgi:hypothetical protein
MVVAIVLGGFVIGIIVNVMVSATR